MTPERFGPEQDSPHFSLRVYTLDADGTVTSDTGTMHVDGAQEPSTSTAYPLCGCPGCRTARGEP
ncbi:hypothetical protein AB0I16_16605 [Streptomyces sp. NPDC050703]|uniref:hypothetical protein n=1 Tax=Streptomyces sp. NPDC050703 TaxID=3157218 RepID=UPI0034226690